MGYRGMGHMGNEAHREYGVQGVWATWVIGHMVNGSHGQWSLWVMGPMGNGAHGAIVYMGYGVQGV